jgi:N-acetylmuramoyl-L-alanine amidase CwlA
MSDIQAVCSRKYRAVHTSGTRDTTEIKWIVLHSEEAVTAESAATWFANPKSGGSAHLCVDDTICYRTLNNEDIPWGSASAFNANSDGFHIEQAGFARWSSIAWMLHRKTIQRAAYKTALHCRAFDVPVQFVTADGLPAKAGITTHAEITKASKRLNPGGSYDHTDPGVFWPRRYFMRQVRRYYEEANV